MINQKKLVFITSNLNIGGAQRYIINLANDLSANYEVILISIQESNHHNLQDELNPSISYFNIGKRALKAIPSLIKIFNETNSDIIFATQSYINSVVIISKLLSKNNCRLVIREATILPSINSLTYWVARIMYQYADTIIAQTKSIKNDIVNSYKVSETNVRILPNYIDDLSLKRKANHLINVKYDNKFTFVFCGRIEKVKKVSFLIKQLANIYNSDNQFEFWIIGDGSEKDRLKKKFKAREFKFLRFFGFKANPYPYLKHADCLLLASEREGFPNVVVEAMALNCIVLINDFKGGAANDILKSDLRKFIYTNGYDLAEKCKKLLELNKVEIEELKNQFYQQSKRFRKDKVLAKIIKLFK